MNGKGNVFKLYLDEANGSKGNSEINGQWPIVSKCIHCPHEVLETETQNICNKETLDNLLKILCVYNLPSETQFSAEEIARVCMIDKKSTGDEITLVVPETIGKYRFEKIGKNQIIDWLHFGGIK